MALETQTLYAELVEALRAADFVRSFSSLAGAFVERERGGRPYWYFRTSEGPSGAQEFYLGSDGEEIRRLEDVYAQGRQGVLRVEERIKRLAAMLRSGGAMVTDKASSKIISGLAAAGIFRMGSALVGTHGFLAMGNMLGVRWSSNIQTQDVDFGAPRRVDVGVPEGPQVIADVPAAIESLEMGFLPRLRLDGGNAATSFVVFGEEWRIDLLTNAQGKDRSAPVRIPRLNAWAEPLEFMDYLLARTQEAAVVGPLGATLIRVPEPARFALHKLLVAGNRPSSQQVKAVKDRQQAWAMLSFLQAERPGDLLIACEDLLQRGAGWRKRLVSQLDRLPGRFQELDESLAR